MTRLELVYLLPYIGSFLLSLGIFVYAWRNYSFQGSGAFKVYVGTQTLTILGFMFEMVSGSIQGKIFWDGFQWIAALSALITFPVFAIKYTEIKFSNPRGLFVFSLVVPAAFSLLVLTDPLHHLIYINPRLTNDAPFTALTYDFGPAVVVMAIYAYSLALWGIGLLLRRFFLSPRLFRTQLTIIILGFSLPLLGTVLPLFGISLTSQRDMTPFTTAAANAIIALGLFRFRLFDVIPVARDRIFESMMDPVVILDNHNNIVDINSAMLTLLNKPISDVIGYNAKDVFEEFPIPIKMYTHVSYARTETTFEIRGKDVYYEMTVWPLYDGDKKITGRIYISHDITALKELEHELRDINVDLEKRVRARTFELSQAYDITLEGWAKALELRDKETEGHSRRVTDITVAVARAMGMSEEDLEPLRRGAILHDIGKMGIPDEILLKDGSLTETERDVIRKHPETAYQLLKQIPFLQDALDIPAFHHEKWDGSGYPRGLKKYEIPLPARIFAVADVWDALLYDRPYRKAWTRDEVVKYMMDQSGKHFDPRVINVFLDMVEKGKL